MNLIALLVLVVAAGAVLSVQAAINGRLGQTVGVLRSSLVTFSVGTLVTGLLILFFEPAQAVSLLEVPKWQLTGALFGVVYMMVMVGAVPIVGTAVAMSSCSLGYRWHNSASQGDRCRWPNTMGALMRTRPLGSLSCSCRACPASSSCCSIRRA